MRRYIDLIESAIREGDLVDLRGYKTDKAIGDYAASVHDLFKGEADFFSTGKFASFAKTYIESGFKPEYAPVIELNVFLRDDRPGPEAKALLARLRAERFNITPAPKWVRGHRPAANPDQEAMGAWGYKAVTMEAARDLFAEREHSPYGAYQESRAGFRTASVNRWDDYGVGFNLSVGGHDARRGDKYGNATRQEHHIIDDAADMAEVAQMFALIARARMSRS